MKYTVNRMNIFTSGKIIEANSPLEAMTAFAATASNLVKAQEVLTCIGNAETPHMTKVRIGIVRRAVGTVPCAECHQSRTVKPDVRLIGTTAMKVAIRDKFGS